jgi:Na+-translocating ferredoxin:NAD+ oxidoreductase subunit B
MKISATDIDALLPQTQCTRCGFNGCMPYAQAIAEHAAPINRCPPGGQKTITALAALLQVSALPLDPAHGMEAPRTVAWIDEDVCIGCTKCIQVCPVDAIAGTQKRMHTVIIAECTGCELCIPSCPVDCIYMHADPMARVEMTDADRQLARQRIDARSQRSAQRATEQAEKIEAKRGELKRATGAFNLQEAIARAKAARGENQG